MQQNDVTMFTVITKNDVTMFAVITENDVTMFAVITLNCIDADDGHALASIDSAVERCAASSLLAS